MTAAATSSPFFHLHHNNTHLSRPSVAVTSFLTGNVSPKYDSILTVPVRQMFLRHILEVLNGSNGRFLLNNDSTSNGVDITNHTSAMGPSEYVGPNPALFWIYGLLIVVIATWGVFANIANLVVLTRKQMRNSINTYLAGLSLFDGLLLLMSLLIYPPMAHCPGSETGGACSFLSYTILLTYPLSLICQTGSVWTCVAITYDRYIAICHPLHLKDICTVTRSKIVLGAIAGFSLLYNIPTFLEIRVTSELLVEETELRKNPIYREAYRTYAYLLVMILVPVAIMLVLNVLIGRAIHKASAERKRMSGKDDRERRLTLMCITVVVVFITLNSTAFLTNFIEAFDRGGALISRTRFQVLVMVGNLFVTLNSATNFVIYCALGLKFRQMFLKIFCPCCYDPAQDYTFLSVRFHSKRQSDHSGIVSMRKIPPASTKALKLNNAAARGSAKQPGTSEREMEPLAFDYTQLRQSQQKFLKPNATQFD